MRRAVHATFVIERSYDATPARVFAAWATPAAKRRWFACHDEWVVSAFELDFRVGGHERLRTGPRGGEVHAFDGRYHEILSGERLVYAYDMRLDDRLISVSLATVEFHSAGRRTRMVFTEQGLFHDGPAAVAEREEGTAIGLDVLGTALA